MDDSYIQFGCGLCAPKGWRNFDAGPSFWLQKYLPFTKPLLIRKGYFNYPVRDIDYADVTRGLPVRKESAKGVYCSHVLEHLPLEGFRAATRNVFDYLEPGGRFRLVLPDLEYLIEKYRSDPNPDAASRFLADSYLGEKDAKRGFSSLVRVLFGRSKHLWMWDYKAIAQELAAAGFVEIRRAYFNDSEDPRFSEVEEFGRWENQLGVECRRP
jgi:predicted SAM-dependent methyltransferase